MKSLSGAIQKVWDGRVLVFIFDEYAPIVTLMEQSVSVERIWVVVHSDCGPYLVCCWYRPPHLQQHRINRDFQDGVQQKKEWSNWSDHTWRFVCTLNPVAYTF